VKTLYVSQQGCYLSLRQESVLIKRGELILDEVQLPLLEQILIFGRSQVTTQVIQACLQREITIAYLSRMGHCYGRVLSIVQGYRQLARNQQLLEPELQLQTARSIVQAKLKNSRVILMRQQRRRSSELTALAIDSLAYLVQQAGEAGSIPRLMGLEGAGAASYFSAFGDCLDGEAFVFMVRSRRPPGNPVNAMLSFGYQVLWSHLLTLIELQGLDPYCGCLHQGSERHAALASDLIEEFRSPIVDSLVLYLVNRGLIDAVTDFEFHDGGCFLNQAGRRKFLQAFLQRMEVVVENEPRWNLLSQQVKAYKRFIYDPSRSYVPYLIR
jgi:CRISPR-associated protein Cas1